MARSSPSLLCPSLCLFALLFHASQARQQWQQGNECQLDRINAIEPDNRIQSEADTIETWNPSHQQFQCAGVAIDEKRKRRQRQGGSSSCNNLFCGLDSSFIAEAFNIDESLARKLQGENDNRGSIVRVEGQLEFARPPKRIQEERQQQGGRGLANGLEETFCSMRMKENIGDPSRADIFAPEAGRITTVNSHNLPVLRWIQLSAERGVLYNEAMRLPHWNLNANSIIYGIRGQARVQIVNENGNSVFDGELREGQVLTVPQNFAVAKRCESDRFEWVSFKTNDNAMVNSIAGRTSAIRAIPADVLANAWRVSPEEARKLKFNRQETHLASSRSQSFRAAAA
ncbi:unnamed protein product [Linum trigynum]|uniref:Cupin type-1 domain-containing protein n=1 Tax=Linum trigynum TaxID=586398 RepID=A0AAV2FMN7_9ROSI